MLTIFIVANTACNKNESISPDLVLSGMKVYDDTLACNQSPNVRIASGNNRLYMAYGNGQSNLLYLNGNVFVNLTLISKLMATDNNGKLLWRTELPQGLDMGGIAELDDGSCLVVQTPISNFISPYPPQFIYFLRYDRNGQQLSLDTLAVPGIEITEFPSLNISKAHNGNVLVFGVADSAYNPYKAFVGEYNNGNWVWLSSFFNFTLGGVAPTSDGGYLLAGYNSANLSLIKISATGDSLWTKTYASQYPVSSVSGIVAAPNGNFYMSFSSASTNTITNIFEVNANGDSLRSVVYDRMSENFSYTLLPMSNGKIFSLMNTVPVLTFPEFPPIYSQVNSFYSIYDEGLNTVSSGNFQTQTTDWIYSACVTSDGDVACFGVLQSYSKNYFVPVLMKKQ